MAKTISNLILGVIRKESWILDHFVSNQYAWRGSALSECFSSYCSCRPLQRWHTI